MRFCVLASGSAGNACFVSTETTRLLIDAGLSVKQLAARMLEIGEDPARLDAVIVSHAHKDHAGCLAKTVKHGIRRGRAIPAYITEPTSTLIDWEGLEAPPVKLFKAGTPFVIGDIEVYPLTLPHDAACTCGFVISANGAKLGIAVDLGFIPDGVRGRFRDVDALILEANHDTEMLRVGPHPTQVKLRVSGRYGHLSNASAFEFLAKDIGPQVRHVVMAHLSQDNNLESLVREGAEEELRRRGIQAGLVLAEQDRRTEVITL